MSLVVETSSGSIQGFVDGAVRIFRGVPFAEPPIGALRFAPNRPPQPGSRVLATRNASASLQAAVNEDWIPEPDRFEGSEDCLYLNVFAPGDEGPHPVVCCIHGGGGFGGTPFDFDGVALAQQGIVVVAMAYRLGLLGLLSVPGVFDEEESANFALLDQIEALRWVKANIAEFGGDPGRVTVAGQSNGARSIVNLLAAPRAQGLFQQAVIMSSTGGGYLVSSREEADELLSQLLAELSVPDDAKQRLRSIDAEDIIRAQTRIALRSPFLLPFLCTIDGSVLPERPIDAVAAGLARDIPLLIGTTRDECDGWAFAEPRSMVVAQETLLGMREIYRSLGHASSDPELLLKVLTASEYWLPAVRLADAQALAGGKSWMYRFDFRLGSNGQRPGATHGADFYALCSPNEQQSRNFARLGTDMSGLIEASNPLREAIVRFVVEGTPDGSAWPTYVPESRATYVFDREARLELDPDRAEREAWTGVL